MLTSPLLCSTVGRPCKDLDRTWLNTVRTGNRSPLADPTMRGMFMGLTLDSGVGDLAMKFHVTLEVGRHAAGGAR